MARLVVLAHRVPFPPNKGEKLRTFHQIEELVRSGHQLTVLAPYELKSELADASALAAKFNIEVICKKLPSRLYRLALAVLKNCSFSETNFYSSELMVAFEKCVQHSDTVLVTASSLAPYVFGLKTLQQAASENIKQPQLLMDFMDVDSDKWRQYAQESGSLKRILYNREAAKIEVLEKAISEKFDTAFVIADTEKQLFESTVINNGNLKVLGNGIDQALFNPSNEKANDVTNYLFSGVMDYKPNIDAMLWFVEHCWPSIVDSVPNAHLIIAGMNPSAEITKLALAPNIDVTGFVDDIKPFFDKAHIFVAPFQIARGVQNKVLQAMACALPVVSTPLGAEGIICEDKFDILLASTASDFGQQAIMLANNHALQVEVGQHALATINASYVWESVLQPLTEVIANT
ncbi:MAG: sugar transferase (PEP-CTERM/EpsH1 system associated) [Alphaproteobacteria bacterium]|jgi:sugar transferase (PEP-CTERM/EpsH1 system associated)